MPRLVRDRHCPHCGVEIPPERPRSCPSCLGSLQQRFLQIGCLSSAPPVVLVAIGLYHALRVLLHP